MKRTLALDIGGTNFSLALFAGEQMMHTETRATLRGAGPEWMLDQMQKIYLAWSIDEPLDGCGIGFGGPVNFFEQRVIYSTHVSGWDNFDLKGEVGRRFGVRAVVDRDTLVGVLGEGHYGAGVGKRPLFYMTISTGIGGGYLQENGFLLRGADSFGCELGHHVVEPDGPDCLCGRNGCLERMCSGLWMERDHGKPAEVLFRDPEFVRRYVVPLARGLKNTIMFFNPARIVIGGGVSRAGDTLFEPLREEIARQMPSWSKARVDVQPAALGRYTVLWGALELARQEIYQMAPPRKGA